MLLLIQIKAIFVSLFLLVFVLFPTCLVAIPFGLSRRLKIVTPVWAIFGRLLLRHACHTKIDISEDNRSPEFQEIPSYGIYISNHQSYMDIPLITTVMQVPPIMKKEVLYIPLFGWLGWLCGAMPVSRSKGHSRKKVFITARKRILEDRIGVQVYPEGTRSKDGEPKPFDKIKKTLLVFAYNEKIPVIPASIYGTHLIISDKGKIHPNRHVGVMVHKEIDPKHFDTPDEFAKACWDKVIEGHSQMKQRLAPLNEN